jgi:hypothetical protein
MADIVNDIRIYRRDFSELRFPCRRSGQAFLSSLPETPGGRAERMGLISAAVAMEIVFICRGGKLWEAIFFPQPTLLKSPK